MMSIILFLIMLIAAVVLWIIAGVFGGILYIALGDIIVCALILMFLIKFVVKLFRKKG